VIVFVLFEKEDGANPAVFRDDLVEWCEDWRVTTDPPVRVYVVKDDEEIL
jgi:hypothetical protein